ncbi:hypothetical protein [Maridesulfovibrio hydrothermalis]|uniref:Uncharacterized protein n=1 Tax=Maridesulfovibrio hydrothermalis AM13 = DSM 14728 TaxID=1121451 RepID=L0RI59_9BACT|nr:hypothetical protein [Maridesulfovibrio hydrothermalis]CCO25301.1 conserved protein of unknown function [Maridesulfovibrio hydrothermalis AM13 = DSM 14728]
MCKGFEDVVAEFNNIAAALEFIGDAIECCESEGVNYNTGGLSYITRVLGDRASRAADCCWGLTSSANISGAEGEGPQTSVDYTVEF